MAKHQVIRDVGQTLLGVLRAELSSQRSKAKAYLAAPTTDFLRKNAPCLVLYLYDIRPSVDVRTNENWHLEEEITDEKGDTYVVRYGRPLDMGLHYLLTASSEDLGEEHEILAVGMRAFLDHPKLSGEALMGDSFMKGDVLPIAADDGFDLQTSSTIFGGFSAAPRLAVGYRLPDRRAPVLRPRARTQQARPRAPHRRVRSAQTTPGKHQRQGAGGGGEAAEDRVSAAEVTPWMEGKFVRPVVIEKRNQRNLPREAASLVRSPTTERKE